MHRNCLAPQVLRRPNTKLRLATLVLIGLACVAAFNFKTVVVVRGQGV